MTASKDSQKDNDTAITERKILALRLRIQERPKNGHYTRQT